MRGNSRWGFLGFSLVEVTMALGLSAFVLVALLGLTSVAYQSLSESGMKLEATSAASETAARWRSVLSWNAAIDTTTTATPPADFPISTSVPAAGSFLQGSDILISNQGLRTSSREEQKFRLAYKVTRSARNPSILQLHLRLTWPADASNPANAYEMVTSSLLGNVR